MTSLSVTLPMPELPSWPRVTLVVTLVTSKGPDTAFGWLAARWGSERLPAILDSGCQLGVVG